MFHWLCASKNDPSIKLDERTCVQCRRWTFEKLHPSPIWPWPTSRGYCSMHRRILQSNYICALFEDHPHV